MGIVVLIGVSIFCGIGCERSAPLPSVTPIANPQAPPVKPTVNVARSEIIGFWRSAPYVAIDLREDGSFATHPDLPGEGTWTLVNGATIKLQYKTDPEPRMTYRIERVAPNQMDVVVEETEQNFNLRKVDAQSSDEQSSNSQE